MCDSLSQPFDYEHEITCIYLRSSPYLFLTVSPFQSISVNIVKEGWAWLVCGRRLFVWKYVQTKKSRIESFELQLPGSDLLHKADLVCLVSYKSTHVPGIVAVSPEGTIRYWPSIAHDGHFIETVAGDLQGQECFSLTDIEPLGYILGTTTSSLSHIYITSSSIVCRTLKIPQGVLAGFGQRVTSFIFGALPSSNSNENKPLTKIIREKSSSDEAVIFVLAGTYLQKWSLVDFQTEKVINLIALLICLSNFCFLFSSFVNMTWRKL